MFAKKIADFKHAKNSRESFSGLNDIFYYSYENGDFVITLQSHEMDLYNAPAIKNLLNNIYQQIIKDKLPLQNIIFDMTKVSHIDSAALGVLLDLKSTTNKYNCNVNVIVIELSPQVKKVFVLTKILEHQFINAYNSYNDFINATKNLIESPLSLSF